MAYLGEPMTYYPPNYPADKYGYGLHEGEYSTEPAGDTYDPDREQNCARYCAWLTAKKAGSLTMDYMERPPGCTCPGESPVVDNKKAGFPVTKTGAEQYDLIEQQVQPGLYNPTPMTLPTQGGTVPAIQLTPQQIEAQVRQIQPAPAGGGLALAAIAALLLLG